MTSAAPRRAAAPADVWASGWSVLIVWLATRLLVVIALASVMATQHIDLVTALTRWDVVHYLQVASDGYADPTNRAFFPGLPLIMNALDHVGFAVVGTTLLAQVASAAAAWALFRQFGAGPAIAWLMAPMTVFTAVAYTEPFFCAAAFWAWERASSGRWHHAAFFAALACTLRVSGLFLVGALCVMAITEDRDFRTRGNNLVWALLGATPLAIYAFYLYTQSGSWLAWYQAQGAGWQRHLGSPLDALHTTLTMTDPAMWPGRPEVPVMFVFEIASVAVGYLAVIVCLIRRRWASAAWVAASAVALSCSGYFLSVNRAVLLWFPVFCGVSGLVGAIRRLGVLATVIVTLIVMADVVLIIWWSTCFFSGGWAS